MLWQLMENGLEELKLLQTVLVLLTTNTVVHDQVLSKVPYTQHTHCRHFYIFKVQSDSTCCVPNTSHIA